MSTLFVRWSLRLVFGFALFAAPALSANAGSLYFSPASGSFNAGETFSVSVYVSSPDQAMNAAAGLVGFPTDLLEVTSVSKSGSVVGLWVQEPSYSNGAGTVSFEGIVLNPGYTGSAGKIITIGFRAKTAGSAHVAFSSGSILANDGFGTNIAASLGTANYTIAPGAGATPPPAPGTPTPPPPAPTIIAGVQLSSATHADPEKWYPIKRPQFSWALGGASAVSTAIDRSATTNPGTISQGVFSKFTADEEYEDGTWYFHLRLRTAAGWGGVSHLRFQIDSAKPDRLEVTEVKRRSLTEPRVKFVIDAHDKTSGIDYFDIQIDEQVTQIWRDDGRHTYETPVLQPGKHLLVVKAVDRAGNFSIVPREFVVKRPSLLLQLWAQAKGLIAIALALFGLVVLLGILLWQHWTTERVTRKQLSRDKRQHSHEAVEEVFERIKKDIQRELTAPKKNRSGKQVVRDEQKFIQRLRKEVAEAERVASRELSRMGRIQKGKS